MGKSAQRIQKVHAYDQQLDANFQDSTFLITCCPDMATQFRCKPGESIWL